MPVDIVSSLCSDDYNDLVVNELLVLVNMLLRPRLLRSTFSFSKSLVILNFCKILVKSTEYNNENPPKQVTKSLVIY